MLLGGSLVGMSDIPRANSVGRRVVLTGLAGAGKSTFSRALSAPTGLPVIVLDFHFWLPGWAEPTEAAWREKQNTLLAGDDWIADGNYHATLDLRLGRADTVVFLDTPWWICARRAFVRGLRSRPIDFELPYGCDQSRFRQVRDEWWLVWRIWRVHRSEREKRAEDHLAARDARGDPRAAIQAGRTPVPGPMSAIPGSFAADQHPEERTLLPPRGRLGIVLGASPGAGDVV
jgi:adenylate kinase family enzyme